MMHELTTPFRTRAVLGPSTVTGFETDEAGEIVEVFTEYGSIPLTPALRAALADRSTVVAPVTR